MNPYLAIPIEVVQIFSDHLKQGMIFNSAGLVFDEIEIRHGLMYRKFDGRIIGGVDLIPESKVFELRESDIPNLLATHIMQIFLVSTDMRVTVPLGYFPTNGVSSQWLFNKISILVDQFLSFQVNINWTSSDGFKQASEFKIKMEAFMKEKKIKYYHIYDYVHVLKNMRNNLLKRILYSPKSSEGHELIFFFLNPFFFLFPFFYSLFFIFIYFLFSFFCIFLFLI